MILLAGILFTAGLDIVTSLQRSAARQALMTSALEVAQGKLEELASVVYEPPLEPLHGRSSHGHRRRGSGARQCRDVPRRQRFHDDGHHTRSSG